MTDHIKNRYEFMFLFDVENGNPNGDPDFANHPRMDPQDQHGLVSDVAVKRRIRNFVQLVKENQRPNAIFVQHASNLNTAIAEAHAETGGLPDGKPGKEKVGNARDWMCKNFFDVRTFGAVMSTGPNAGQVRGPVQIAFSRSVDPINVMDVTVTRMAAAINVPNAISVDQFRELEANTPEDELRTFGRKSVVSYALFVGKGFISANLAKQTGFSREDLKLLFESISNMYEHDRSASKGVMTLRKLYVFKHVGTDDGNEQARENQSMLGCAHAQDLFDLVKVEVDKEALAKEKMEYPRAFTHYKITAADEIRKHLPAGVELLDLPNDKESI